MAVRGGEDRRRGQEGTCELKFRKRCAVLKKGRHVRIRQRIACQMQNLQLVQSRQNIALYPHILLDIQPLRGLAEDTG